MTTTPHDKAHLEWVRKAAAGAPGSSQPQDTTPRRDTMAQRWQWRRETYRALCEWQAQQKAMVAYAAPSDPTPPTTTPPSSLLALREAFKAFDIALRDAAARVDALKLELKTHQ